jgi:hypothetical protein
MDGGKQIGRRFSSLDSGATEEEKEHYHIPPYLFMERYLNPREFYSDTTD